MMLVENIERVIVKDFFMMISWLPKVSAQILTQNDQARKCEIIIKWLGGSTSQHSCLGLKEGSSGAIILAALSI